MRFIVAVLVALVSSLLLACPSRACSPPFPAEPHGWPRPGASGVSTATNVFVLANLAPNPKVEVRVNGNLLALDPPVFVERIWDFGAGPSGMWKVPFPDMLPASSEIVVSQPQPDGGGAELTRFTTAAGYDKDSGTAPVLRSINLTRVRYPVSEIGAGGCVFAEYHGFVELDWDAALVPATGADAVVYKIWLAPKTGGLVQSFTFLGGQHFAGHAPVSPSYMPSMIWSPDLDPTREYCATITAFGYGDRARVELRSEQRCAPVAQLCEEGAADCSSTAIDAGVATDSGPAGDASTAGEAGKAGGCSTSAGGVSLLGAALGLTALAARRWRRG